MIMAVIYQCRHCNQQVGAFHHETVNTEHLGLDQLTEEERTDMVQMHENGNMEIKTICENCQEALESNPHYHELDSFIQ